MNDKEYNALVPIDEDIREEFYEDNTDEDDAVNDECYPLPADHNARTYLWGVVSLVLAIAALPLCIFLPWCGALISALAIAAGALSRFKLGFFTGLSLSGMIIGIIGAVSGILLTAAELIGMI